MNSIIDRQIAEKLIRWYVSIKYYSHENSQARQFAIKDLADVRSQYGWKAMKKACKHSACTGIVEFKYLCSRFNVDDLKIKR